MKKNRIIILSVLGCATICGVLTYKQNDSKNYVIEKGGTKNYIEIHRQPYQPLLTLK